MLIMDACLSLPAFGLLAVALASGCAGGAAGAAAAPPAGTPATSAPATSAPVTSAPVGTSAPAAASAPAGASGSTVAAGTNASGSELCRLPPEPGPCEALIVRWHFDAATGRCEMFDYGGCEGNANNFRSEKECLAACVTK